MKIFWLSWRDVKNPDSGGAEKVAIEITSRFVRNGHKVTIFTSRFNSAGENETIRKVNIIRQGNKLTCRFWAFLYYLKNKDFDLIIDEINTIPFFSIFYAKDKTIALIHQLAKEYWFTQTFWPLSTIGFWLEPFLLKFYKNNPTTVVSMSTKNDLLNLGFKKIRIIREGLDFKPQLPNYKNNLILFLGRLTPAKVPQDAILAFKLILKEFPDAKLAVIGKGKSNFVRSLKSLSKKLHLTERISFTDFVSDSDKIKLLKKAKIILIPSKREGWSLVATEAQATGCVPIAYNVPGLRDSVKNNQTGILTDPNPQALAKDAIKVLQNETLRLKLAQNGYEWSQKFSWKNTYEDFKKILSERKSART